MSKKLFIQSYGCAMNFSDSEIVASILKKEGYTLCDQIENSVLNLVNNSCKKWLLKLITVAPTVWTSDWVWAKFANSAASSFDIWSIPLNPLAQPKNLLVVFPVYVIISLSIFNKP